MASKHNNRKQKRRKTRPHKLAQASDGRLGSDRMGRVDRSSETRSGEALAVAWGVTVTMLVFCNLFNVGLHTYVSQNPDAQQLAVLGELLLFAGSVVGAISLIILPLLYRLRNVGPPRGIAVFGACLAAAPIMALLMKTLR